MCERPGETIRWDTLTQRVHLGRINTTRWVRSFAKHASAEPGAKSQYNPNLTPNQVRELELACARGEAGMIVAETARITTYFRRIDPDKDLPAAEKYVGVSRGEFTNFIFVIRQSNGSVHGFPITRDELIRNKRVDKRDLDG